MTEVRIIPHALTAETIPSEGATIGYTGPAYFGKDFADRGYISCRFLVTEHTALGFYGLIATDEDEPNFEVFVLLGDEGAQMLHGYVT